MEKHHPARNPLGMLRKAIEEDWPKPVNQAAEASFQQSPAMVFARHFYAGQASHHNHPVALPSSTDLAGAAPLLQALLAIWPDPSQVERWGRQFARHVAQQQRPDRAAMSLSLAARLCGDAFVEWMRRHRDRHAREIASAQRVADETRYKGDYLRYLLAAEERLREREPVRYQAFVDYREQRRRGLLRVARNGVQSTLLRAFEAPAARLEDFRDFFSGEVLDFAGWQAWHNPQEATA